MTRGTLWLQQVCQGGLEHAAPAPLNRYQQRVRHTDCAGCIVGKDVGTCDQTAGADGESPSMARLLDRLAELDRPLTPPELLPRSVMRGLNRAGRAPDRSGTAWWTIPFVSARQTDIMSGASMLCGCALDGRCRLLSRLCETHCVGPSGLLFGVASRARTGAPVAPRRGKEGTQPLNISALCLHELN